MAALLGGRLAPATAAERRAEILRLKRKYARPIAARAKFRTYNANYRAMQKLYSEWPYKLDRAAAILEKRKKKEEAAKKAVQKAKTAKKTAAKATRKAARAVAAAVN